LLIMAAVFMAFLVIGIAMPVLPLQVHRELGFGTFLVGLVTGVQFGAAILSRVWAGRYSDARGPKRATMAGLVLASAAGLVYDLSLTVAATPVLSLMVLLLGRALLGVGESLIITGAQSWALAILTVQNTSKALAWVGSAMFAAFAVGAPIGTALYASHGFAGIALATTLSPLATLLFVAPLQGVASASSVRTGAMKVMAAIWMPGLGAALSSIGFGAIVAFSALLFVERGWAPWVPFTAFASAFIVTRLLLGHLADRFGGARVALICVLVETAGLALMWLAPSFALTLTGAAVTGLGYALVYPGLGVEAVRLAPPDSRGLAMGAYTAFLDLALGISGPGLGLIAGAAGLDAVFLASACAAIGAAAIAVMLIRAQSRKDHERNAT
jgi:MFS family permease